MPAIGGPGRGGRRNRHVSTGAMRRDDHDQSPRGERGLTGADMSSFAQTEQGKALFFSMQALERTG